MPKKNATKLVEISAQRWHELHLAALRCQRFARKHSPGAKVTEAEILEALIGGGLLEAEIAVDEARSPKAPRKSVRS